MKKFIVIMIWFLSLIPMTAYPADNFSDSSSTPPESTQSDLPPAVAKLSSPKQPVAETKTIAGSQNDDLSMQSFIGILNKQLPLTPEQIIALHKAFQDSQKAASASPDTPARPTTSSILVNLAPNAVPPIIRLGAGYISSLVFIDSTGQPWPVAAYSVGDPGSFNIQWDKKGNTLLVQSDTFYKRSNLAVLLKDLNTPVMLTLLPGQTAIDYRVDLRIPGAGPNAVFAREDLPNTEDPVLLAVLNGVPPKGARTLKILGDNNTQAWLMNDKLFLRTPLIVISPAWQAVMTSVDGTHAYEIQPSSVILALENGQDKTIKLILEGLS